LLPSFDVLCPPLAALIVVFSVLLWEQLLWPNYTTNRPMERLDIFL
jgi:hypothetical protein